jgi:hypothetical protein
VGIGSLTLPYLKARGFTGGFMLYPLVSRFQSKANAWIGIVGFTFLSLFTILATFVSALYFIAFYVFGMVGGLLY